MANFKIKEREVVDMANFNFQGKIIRQFWGKIIRQSTKLMRKSCLQFVTGGGV